MPLIRKVWESEEIPQEWNAGSITTIWKGKGDKECLNNHRGITVSSAIGNIIEEVIDKRMEKTISFSQGQAGGVKGASTSDHLFLLRSLMTLAQANKSNLFLTFYDVQKAYDRADVNNLLHVIWNAGVRGKMWRILKNLSTNLTAVVKTRYGPSRPIERHTGGKQGSRVFGRLFSKQMDTLSEDFVSKHEEKIKVNDEFSIGCLEWVDDVVTATSGLNNQNSVLKIVDDFARKNKLEWGESKCQVMQVGKKITIPSEWKLGDKTITNTTAYKYLGDTVTSDNKNKRNLEIKENKIEATVRQINTTASSDIMRGVEARVILTLYEKSIIPSFTNNCESWTLSKTEEKQVDRIGVKTLKRLFSLPTTTPNAAVIHNFGQLFFTQEIDKKRFMFLHKLLSRGNDHWTKSMLLHLQSRNIGWAKNMKEKLEEYGLEPNWDAIQTQTKNQWKTTVGEAVDKKNKEKIIKNCITETDDGTKINTKTKFTHQQLTNSTSDKHQPVVEVIAGNKQRAKTLILARHGMLECGTNFKGTMPQVCRTCRITDNENHRLNECTLYKDINLAHDHEKSSFEHIYSNDNHTLNNIINDLEKVWEFRYANGRMKKTLQ